MDALDPPDPCTDVGVEVALLDSAGVIVAVNQAWQDFCLHNDGDLNRSGVGRSYVEVCAAADNDEPARAVLAAIRAALAGDLVAPVTVEISCDAPGQPRWFDVLVSSRIAADGRCVGATVTLSRSRASRRPAAGHPGATPQSEVRFPDTIRDELEAQVAQLTERVSQILVAHRRLHGLRRANAAMVVESSVPGVLTQLRAFAVELGLGPALIATTDDGSAPGRLSVAIPVNGSVFANVILTPTDDAGFSRDDEWLARALVETAGRAITSAMVAADAERRQRWQHALADLATALLTGAGPDPLKCLTDVVAIGAAAEQAYIAPSADGAPSAPSAEQEALIASVLRSAMARATGQTMAAPLPGGGSGPARAIVVVRPSDAEPFEPADAEQLDWFASQAAVVLALHESR